MKRIKLTIEDEDLGLLCTTAIRYCQGRQTYMPDLIRSIVRPLLPKLRDEELNIMLEDCNFQACMHLYGDERIDKPGWLKWKEELKAERERRMSNA